MALHTNNETENSVEVEPEVTIEEGTKENTPETKVTDREELNKTFQQLVSSNENLDNSDNGENVNHKDYMEIVKINIELIQSILDFHSNNESDIKVQNYLTKTFDSLNNNPYKKMVGENGVGWFALFCTLQGLQKAGNQDALDALIVGLTNLMEIQIETGLLTSNFNMDFIVAQDPSLGLLVSMLSRLGLAIIEDRNSNADDSSDIDEAYEKVKDETIGLAKEVVNSSYTYSDDDESTFTKILKYGCAILGGAAVGYLGYKGYQMFTEDNVNDVVFIDMEDYD